MVAATLSSGTSVAAPATVIQITDQLARDLATGLTDDKITSRAHLADLGVTGGLATKITTAEHRIAAAKGLPSGTPLLTLRPGNKRAGEPLFAAAPDDDKAMSFKAYDRNGRSHELATAKAPDRPVLLVDVDVERAVNLGMEVIRQAMPAPKVAAAGYWATQVSRVRVNDVQEPWFKGDAEIFTLVSGFGLDGKVRVDPVTMPYLDEEDTTYSPNQLLVHWNAYKYDLADVVMMEDDGDTNYKALAQALVAALLTIVDGGAYIPLVSAVLDAIPDSWYTDDPDYVESWYTLAEQGSGVRNGASGRGWIETRPYWVREL